MNVSSVQIAFKQDKYNLQGLSEFSKLHRNEQKMLIQNEEIRQKFNEVHPELKFDEKLTPLQKYVEDTVASSRRMAKELKAMFRKGKK